MNEPPVIPPPYSAPPPPPFAPAPKPRRNNLVIGLIAGGVVFFLVLATVIAARFGNLKVEPSPIAGFGKPKVVRKFAEGWAAYDFKDIGCEITLPEPPAPQKIDWGSDGLFLREWASYSLSGEGFNVDLNAYQFQLRTTLTELAEGNFENYQEEPSTKDVQQETFASDFAGVPAREQTLTYTQEGEPFITKSYFFEHRSHTVSLQFHYWKDSDPSIHKAMRRITDSFHLK